METEMEKGKPLEPNNPEQEAKVLENLVEWLRDSETKNSVKLLQARLVLEGVSRRLRGIDTRGWLGPRGWLGHC